MANSNGWGDGAGNNTIGWGQGANNSISWGKSHSLSAAGLTDIVGITTDADAQAFITAAAITDPTQQSAIDALVKGMKADGVWTKMKAIYPFVGGTASTHKWNLKDPRDLDAAFRLVFNGGWTHSSTGATPNGTNGYADTKFNPSLNGQLNSAHLSYYSRTNNSLDNQIEIGANAPLNAHFLCFRFNAAIGAYHGINSADTPSSAFTPSTGLFVGSRIVSTTGKFYTNGTLALTDNKVSTNRPNTTFSVGALNNNGTQAFFTTKQTAFSSIGDGLTDTDAANLYTRVQAYQTALSRQV
jgi:hypothetical protein